MISLASVLLINVAMKISHTRSLLRELLKRRAVRSDVDKRLTCAFAVIGGIFAEEFGSEIILWSLDLGGDFEEFFHRTRNERFTRRSGSDESDVLIRKYCVEVKVTEPDAPLKGGTDHEIKRSVNKRLRALYVFCVQAPVFI